MRLTFVTYNIHSCKGVGGRFDPESIVKVLQEIDADVIALQEVEHHMVCDLNVLEYLATETGFTAVAGPTLLRETRHYGNALLTRLPILVHNQIDLSVPGREPRGAIDVTLHCEGQQIRTMATHLGLSPGERRKQVRQILALLEAPAADICVLMGDLNEWFLWGRNLRWLRAHFQETPNYPTFPARWPVFALDHLWVSPRERLATLEVHTTPLARKASDHLPLKGVIEI